jgi:hypothetical protein
MISMFAVEPFIGAGWAQMAHSSPTSYPQVVHVDRLALAQNGHYRVAPGRQNPICWVSDAKQTQTPKKASKIIPDLIRVARARAERDRSIP